MPRLIILAFLIILQPSFGKAQKMSTAMNNDFLKANGFYVSYPILPINKNVEFSIIIDRAQFDSLLQHYVGKKIEEQLRPRDFGENLPITAYQEIAKSTRYVLSNGYFAVDRSSVHKTVPFLIYKDHEDYKLMLRFLEMLPNINNDKTKKIEPVIYCQLNNDIEIKNFLRTNAHRMRFQTSKSNDVQKIYIWEDGMVIEARYSPGKNYFLTGNVLDKEIYHDLVIYSTFEQWAIRSGTDIEEVDETNFPDYFAQFMYNDTSSIEIKVINAQNASRIKENLRPKSILGKWSVDYSNAVEFSDRTVLSQYSEFIFFEFKSMDDFLIVDSVIQIGENRNPVKSEMVRMWDEIEQKIEDLENVKRILDNRLAIKQPENVTGLTAELEDFDKRANRYFFDSKFIREFFSSIVAYVGDVVIKYNGGKWVYDKIGERYVIELPNSKKLDLSPYLYQEMLQQRYTHHFSSSALLDGLIKGLSFEVSPSKIR